MDHVTTGSIQLSWDPTARLAVLRFERDTKATGRDAAVLLEAMIRWVGTEGQPFGLLGDGGKLSGVDAEYRSAWRQFLGQYRNEAYVAFFNMGPVIRIAAEMFRIGSRLHLKAFAEESEARDWLRGLGIAA